MTETRCWSGLRYFLGCEWVRVWANLVGCGPGFTRFLLRIDNNSNLGTNNNNYIIVIGFYKLIVILSKEKVFCDNRISI